jgi:hypothetical protein
MGIVDSLFGGGSQETQVKLPDYIRQPADDIGTAIGNIFLNNPNGPLTPQQQAALRGIEQQATAGNPLVQTGNNFLAGLFGSGGLTNGQSALAGGLVNGQFQNPAAQGYGNIAYGGYTNPANQGLGSIGYGGYTNPAAQGLGAIGYGGYTNRAADGLGQLGYQGYNNQANAGLQSFANNGYNNGATDRLSQFADQGYYNPATGGFEAAAGGQFQNDAMSEARRVALGGDLGANPFLESNYRRAADVAGKNFRENVIPGMDRNAAAQGRLGSNRYAAARNDAEDAYSRNNNDLATQIFGAAYDTDRARQQQALGLYGNLGEAAINTRLRGIEGIAGLTEQQVSNRLGALNSVGQFGEQQASNRLNALGQLSQNDIAQYNTRLGALNNLGQIDESQASNRIGALNSLGGFAENQMQTRVNALGQLGSLGESQMRTRLDALGGLGQLGQQDVQNRLAGAGLYQQGIGNMFGGLSSLPQLDQMRYSDLTRLFDSGTTRQNARYGEVGRAAAVLGQLPYGQTTSQSQSFNPFTQALGLGTSIAALPMSSVGGAGLAGLFGGGAAAAGGGAAGAGIASALPAAFLSDARLKRDIVRIGALPSGLPVYRYRYIWDDAEQVGVMAQEAMALFPEAVIQTASGFLAVDYSRIA